MSFAGHRLRQFRDGHPRSAIRQGVTFLYSLSVILCRTAEGAHRVLKSPGFFVNVGAYHQATKTTTAFETTPVYMFSFAKILHRLTVQIPWKDLSNKYTPRNLFAPAPFRAPNRLQLSSCYHTSAGSLTSDSESSYCSPELSSAPCISKRACARAGFRYRQGAAGWRALAVIKCPRFRRPGLG